MKTETKVFAGILIFSLFLVVGAAFLLGNSSPNSTTAPVQSDQIYEIDYSKGQKVGSDSAKVRLVEFSDFQCPACRSFEPVVKQILNTHPNDIQLIYRHFPLSQHKHAKLAANFAEYAATENKFIEAHDRLFETQESWTNLVDAKDFFLDLGKQIGLDEQELEEVLATSPYNAKIEEDFQEGIRLGVSSTPTFFVNNKKLELQSFADLNTAIEAELAK